MKATSFLPITAMAALVCVQTSDLQAELFLGPPNWNIEHTGDWFMGASGDSFVDIVDEGGQIEGTGRLNIGATSADEGDADFRSSDIPLGDAALGEAPLAIEFYVKFTEPVKPGETVLVQFRFFGGPHNADYKGEVNIDINDGAEGIDTSLIDEWQKFRMEDITAHEEANYADFRTSVNIWTEWSSGEAQFDGFRATTPMPEMKTPVSITHAPANEVVFYGEVGNRYRIESRPVSSDDEEDWTPVTDPIVGNDETVTWMFSTRDDDTRKVFRVRTD